MLWLDIETYQWPSDHTKNREFIETMGKELTVSGALQKYSSKVVLIVMLMTNMNLLSIFIFFFCSTIAYAAEFRLYLNDL